ncbi:sigma-70 family rna polymerase sigma factor : RNA polymerase sigma factor, sigma-70 family OS=Singulisphaera acidiphila (strain ATCC BAA-1392 / DSM 18658 / VKM B-2454 / MOB10) GN=Sinac_7487 PE=4 SV=1 [Gemmata massiliana]|uniref:Sigma-70 family rna polymerase sigma factor: RNA polymerase sigma factor, sigma-70 family n=1 Tax=Gemmata massiliana TaxID=1210884 RepID=A0A6P2CSX1_9BACT|nr:TIGR03067 domain-containing protein [Gemmata massiliana]VTR91476.1 sigma-70 family rna polymerase sigma factor : RNA polymerase sigma factor, sigma-70 family OS=Singulisphaera acidiphila (strain ATCC BAA-1392 / DSM 18658 / VKM B-2454 / MOB10) GN=Sinac_7487 PE=4 SV=1 [Gemmata massiliana]
MIRAVTVALLTLFASHGTAVRAADPAADEVKKLQGEWAAVEVELNGKKVGKDDAKSMRFVFKDNELVARDTDKPGRERKKTFKLDPSKTPKEIDITSLDGQEKDKTAACIYKLDVDRLTICMPYFVEDASVRPKEFKVGAKDGLMLLTLERVKAK